MRHPNGTAQDPINILAQDQILTQENQKPTPATNRAGVGFKSRLPLKDLS